MAALIAALVLVAFLLGYRFYARYIGEKIYADHEDIVTPAHEFEDGTDFVPTRRHVLFGHHFTSIAGAAPIIGPCIAVYWGWLPALIWVVIGTIFMGAVHDFGALMISLREKGRSIADIAGTVISPRARVMFLCFVLVLTWLVLAVFAMAIAGLFVKVPSSVVPINVEIIIAIGIGWLIYKKKVDPLIPSLVALALLYLFVYLGQYMPVSLKEIFSMSSGEARTTWILMLFAYSCVASLLPVWLLLQPRDFINSHQLIVGLSLLFLGLFLYAPDFDAPAIRTSADGAPGLFPLLFVTIACGAISGFHGLVSSGTTSKQVDKLSDARAIGFGSMLGEGSLALASVMAAAAGIALYEGPCSIGVDQIQVQSLNWSVYYDSWANAAANKGLAFVLGGGAFVNQLGIPSNIAITLMTVLVISFAATTLDTAMRIQRFIVAEIGAVLKLRFLQNRFVATVIAVVPALALALAKVPDPNNPARQIEAAFVLWPIFGASNQMMAALTLLVLVLYFSAKKKPVLPLVLPMLFVMAITLTALIANMAKFLQQENVLMISFTALLLALVLWMLAEGVAVMMKRRAEGKNAH